jgi:voltage-gated potassium channel
MRSSDTAGAAAREAAASGDARAYDDWQFRELLVGRLARLGTLVAMLLIGGTLGFVLTEDTSAWDGFTWTLDTIATVGSVPAPDSTGGQIVKAVLIVLGVGTLYYALVSATEFFVAGHVTGLLDARKRQQIVDGISEHYLVCGYGRVGRQVVRDLRAAGASYVVIDRNAQSLERADAVGVPWLQGDASDEELLLRAGIERARALIACVDSDAENVFITLTARELRPDLTVVARASASEAEQKLRRAGAERVVSPYKSSGSEMARLALHPQVAGVVDVSPEYRMEEIDVSPGCPGAGQALADVAGPAIVAALRKDGGELIPRPPGDTVVEPGDVLIVIGTDETIGRLEELFTPEKSA